MSCGEQEFQKELGQWRREPGAGKKKPKYSYRTVEELKAHGKLSDRTMVTPAGELAKVKVSSLCAGTIALALLALALLTPSGTRIIWRMIALFWSHLLLYHDVGTAQLLLMYYYSEVLLM